jgi:putative transcriptional regulator
MAEVEQVIAGDARAAERLTVRRVRLPEDPPDFGPQQVRRLREKLNVSQAVFARLIGASPALVRAWEQGGRQPSPMARRLLESISNNPDPWRQMLRPAV